MGQKFEHDIEPDKKGTKRINGDMSKDRTVQNSEKLLKNLKIFAIHLILEHTISKPELQSQQKKNLSFNLWSCLLLLKTKLPYLKMEEYKLL